MTKMGGKRSLARESVLLVGDCEDGGRIVAGIRALAAATKDTIKSKNVLPIIPRRMEAGGMSDYRLYYLNPEDKIMKAEWLDANSDDEAIVWVRVMKLPFACEVWNRNRLVARMPPPPAE